jgi:hypothetical protein
MSIFIECKQNHVLPAFPRASLPVHSPLITQFTAILTWLNPLNAGLNPICHLLALLGGATIVVVSRLRVIEEKRGYWFLF